MTAVIFEFWALFAVFCTVLTSRGKQFAPGLLLPKGPPRVGSARGPAQFAPGLLLLGGFLMADPLPQNAKHGGLENMGSQKGDVWGGPVSNWSKLAKMGDR